MVDTSRSIKVTIDPTGAEDGVKRLKTSLTSLSQIGKLTAANNNEMAGSIGRIGTVSASSSTNIKKLGQEAGLTNNRFSSLSNGVKGAVTQLTSFRGIMATLGIGYVAKQLMDLSDGYSSIQAKLTLATARTGSFGQANKDVISIANKTRSDLGAVTDLYGTLARNADQLHLSQLQVARATTTVGMALKIGGQGAAQNEAAILQLSQALGAGKLAGDEFASLAENAPRLMSLFAESLGVPRGALKQMAADGKLTGDVLTKALTDPKMVATIEKEFGKIPVTFADIGVAASNTAVLITGAFAKGFGITDTLAVILAKVQQWATDLAPRFEQIGKIARGAFDTLSPIFTNLMAVGGKALDFLSNNIDTLSKLAMVAATSFIAFKAAAGLSWMTNSLGQLLALQKALGATGTFSALFGEGMKIAQSGVRGLTAAIAANPIGAIAVALTTTIALLYQFRDSIQLGGGSIASLGDLGRATWEAISGGLRSFVDWASEAWAKVSGWFSEMFSGISDWASSTFGDLDFSLLGFMRGAARVVDFVIGAFYGSYKAIVAYYSALPTALSTIFVNAFNRATEIVEGFINTAVSGINKVIGFANDLGANFSMLGNVDLGRMKGGGAVTLGKEVGDAFKSGFTHSVEGALNGLVKRADQIARERKAKEKQGGAVDPNKPASSTTSSTSTDKKDKKDKKGNQQEDFWKGLERELELSKLTTLEVEKRSKELDYEKIVGRDINATEKQRLSNLLEQTKTYKFLQSANDNHRKAMIDLDKEEALFKAKMNGATEEQIAIQKAVGETVANAQKEGVKLSQDQLDILTAQITAEEKKRQAIDKTNKALERGVDLVNEGLKSEVDKRTQEYDRTAIRSSVGSYSEKLGRVITQDDVDKAIEAYNRGIVDTANTFRDELGQRINELGDQIGGKWGSAISKIGQMLQNMVQASQGNYGGFGALGSIANVLSFSTDGGKTFNGLFGQKFATTLSGGIKDGMTGVTDNLFSLNKSTTSGFGSLKNAFGKGGDLVKGLGNVMGTAMAGAQVGGAVAGLGNALGLKMSNTGAQVGGAIGSFIPIPGGSIIGSIIGGVFGGLFKKAKWGTSTITTGSDGSLEVGGTRGNKSAYKANSSSAAGSVISSLNDLASTLGGDITGTPNISIGQYKGKWRVSNIGRTGKLKGGSGRTDIKDFGKDGAEEAISYAITTAIKQGVMTGISSFSQRVLQNMDLSEATQLAQSYESILSSLKAYKNPVAGAVDEVVKSIDTLAKQMKKAGATSDELAKVEEYRTIKLQETLKSQLSGFNDLMKQLNGEGAGVSKLTLLNEDLNKLNSYRSILASGGTVNQSDFTALGQEIMGYASDLYGSQTGRFQNIREDLVTLTQQALNNATNEFNNAADSGDTYTAITDQTSQVTASIAVTNDTLAQILSAIKSGTNLKAATQLAVNGRLVSFK